MNKDYKSMDEISAVLAKNDTYVLTDNEESVADELFTLPQSASIEKPETEYAGLGKRMGAYLVDMFIVISIILLLNLISLKSTHSYQYTFYHKLIAALVIWTLYYGFFESSIFQATPGKMLFKLKVIDIQGNRISFIRASLRFLASFLSILPVGLGIWDIEANPCFQGWHDRLLGCHITISPPVDLKTVNRIKVQ